eukprot:Gb_19543 [translate_table: standard]
MFTAAPSSRASRDNPNPPRRDDIGRVSDKNYASKLLNLRAALSEKELQLVELRVQYNSLVNKSVEAHRSWEEALKAKDRIIEQLHKSFRAKLHALKRQEKLLEETRQAILEQRESENTELNRKDLEISFLKAKNAKLSEELAGQQQIIAQLKSQLKERDKKALSQSSYLISKVEVLNKRVQELEAELWKKDEKTELNKKELEISFLKAKNAKQVQELEEQRKIIAKLKSQLEEGDKKELEYRRKKYNDMKVLVWKRDCTVAELQHAEQELQSALTKHKEECEALESAKIKLEKDKVEYEKNMARLKEEVTNLEAMVLQDETLKEEMQIQEEFIRDLQQQVRSLHRDLNMRETALSAKVTELQEIHEENKLLVQEYELLKHEYEFLKQENEKLQQKLSKLEEQLTVAKLMEERAEERAGLASSHVDIYRGSQRNQQFLGNAGNSINANMYTEELSLPQSESLFNPSDQNAKHLVVQHPVLSTSRPLVENGYMIYGSLPLHSFRSRDYNPKYNHDKEEGRKDGISKHFEWSHPNTYTLLQHSSENMLEENLEKTKMSETVAMKYELNQSSPVACVAVSPGFHVQEQNHNSQDPHANEFESIQEEIKKREKRWRQTEAKMRAELNRRMTQLHEEGYCDPGRQRR